MFFLAELKGTSSLTNIRHPTICAGDPIYNTLSLVEGGGLDLLDVLRSGIESGGV